MNSEIGMNPQQMGRNYPTPGSTHTPLPLQEATDVSVAG